MTATVRSPGEPVARLSPLAAPIACGCCLAAGAAYVAASNPSDGGVFLPCPFRTLTGLWCPGCGLTRATHQLFHGDIHQALRYNLFVVVILLGLGSAWLAWTLGAAGRSIRVRIPVWVQVASVAVLLTFAVVRNLPGVPGLRG
jgi:hypothetical protein